MNVGSLIKALLKDSEQRSKRAQQTVGGREGETVPFVCGLHGSKDLIKMIIRDWSQRRKHDETVRREKCLGGWQQML